MSPGDASGAGHREDGTASVELIAAVPVLLLVLLLAAQIALAGQALWSAGIAARAGARAALVGADAKAAARRALPPSLRRGLKVDADDAVTVAVAVPRLLPLLPPLRLRGSASLRPGR